MQCEHPWDCVLTGNTKRQRCHMPTSLQPSCTATCSPQVSPAPLSYAHFESAQLLHCNMLTSSQATQAQPCKASLAFSGSRWNILTARPTSLQPVDMGAQASSDSTDIPFWAEALMCWWSAASTSWRLCQGATVRRRKSDLRRSQHSTAAPVEQGNGLKMTSKLAPHGGAHAALTDGCLRDPTLFSCPATSSALARSRPTCRHISHSRQRDRQLQGQSLPIHLEPLTLLSGCCAAAMLLRRAARLGSLSCPRCLVHPCLCSFCREWWREAMPTAGLTCGPAGSCEASGLPQMCMAQPQVARLVHPAGGEIEQPHTAATDGPLCMRRTAGCCTSCCRDL